MFYFYKTTNLINGNFYYGSGTLKEKDTYLGSGIWVKRAIHKHRKSSFKKEILKYFDTRKEAFDFENRFLNLYQISSIKESYNIKDAAEGGDIFTNNPNKEQIRENLKAGQHKRHKDNPVSDELREIFSIAQKKRFDTVGVSNETREKQSISGTERLKDPAERAKCNAFKDVTPEREAELKAIWSKAATGVKNGRCKYPHPVQQLDKETGLILKVWDNVFQARDGGGFSRKYIISASKSGGSHGGYCWKFIAVKTNKLKS
jgi:hypothetical protein